MAIRSESLGDDLKAWAADQLQVELQSPPAQVRAAYLRQMQHDNGGPNLTAREAMLILTGRNNAARPTLALEAAEEKLQREVDDFASRYFALAIAERKVEWESLRGRGQGFVRVDTRLAALRPGLYIVLPHLDRRSIVGQLVLVVCELFVLRPSARAAKRQSCLEEVKRSGEWTAWAEAAQALRKSHAAVAALEPEVVATLADAVVRERDKEQLGRRMRKVAQPAGGGNRFSYWWVWLVVMCLLTCARACNTGSSTKTDPSVVPQQPEFKMQLKDFDQNKKARLGNDGKEMQLQGDRDALERLFGKEKAQELPGPKKGQAGPAPTDKQGPP
jgi:hypothetical protein